MAGRILVLDDEENYAEMLQNLLHVNDFRVDLSTRPERAIDQLKEIPYDLVISDYKMPVMDGADFLKKARELYPNLPFILVSGLMNTPELVKVANMSVTLVMEKPLDANVFLKHVARFSEPMTAAEKEAFAHESKDDGASAASKIFNYPEEPCFFSAECTASKRFMQYAWNICKDGSYAFILNPKGGDGDLAVKDISGWRGNSDRPVTHIAFSDLQSGGLAYLKSVLEQAESSNVLAVSLNCAEQLSEARSLVDQFREVSDRPNGILLVYLMESDISAADFKEQVGESGAVLPPLCDRPADTASYARRFARLSADHLNKPKCADFLADVVYALLAFDWPGNYQQVQSVITEAVNASEDEPLALALLQDKLGMDADLISAPSARLSVMMKHAQKRYLNNALAASSMSPSDLSISLGLGSGVQTAEDIHRMPLVNSKLSSL
jgi:CheY-like chemotaxis protein